MTSKIWLVEDERAIADTLIYTLKTDGFDVVWFEHGHKVLQMLETDQPDLAILDIGLPDINGFELSRKILTHHNFPFIFLTARAEEVDRIVGLELGADDYISKPFSPREVSVRVRNILRRTEKIVPTESKETHIGHFILNEEATSIHYHHQPLTLTRYEYLLLKTLLVAPNRVFSRQQLMDNVWIEENSLDRTVDTHIKTIRAKLKAIDEHASPIVTHRGFGYSLSLS